MTEETELCGFQPTGRSEDVPKPPKYNLNAEFWRTQWSEASGAHLMEYLRAEKLQEQLNTAKKNIDNLEDHLLPYNKEMIRKIRDEKMQLVTVDEFVKLQKESLTAIRENDKLKEQLDTAKKALTEISEIINYDIHECDYGYDNSCELNSSLDMYSVENVQSIIDSTLAEIGENDG